MVTLRRVEDGVARLIQRALERDRTRRYRDAGEMLTALETRDRHVARAAAASETPSTEAVGAEPKAASVTSGPAPSRGRTDPWIVTAAVLAGALAAVLIMPRVFRADAPTGMASKSNSARAAVPVAESTTRTAEAPRPRDAPTAPAASSAPTASSSPAVSDAGIVMAPVAAPAVRAATRAAHAGATAPREFGMLHVVVLPWGEVWIDGVARGLAPVHARVVPGPHTVVIRGAIDRTRRVTVAAGASVAVSESAE